MYNCEPVTGEEKEERVWQERGKEDMKCPSVTQHSKEEE
jgi:hypothetical protein